MHFYLFKMRSRGVRVVTLTISQKRQRKPNISLLLRYMNRKKKNTQINLVENKKIKNTFHMNNCKSCPHFEICQFTAIVCLSFEISTLVLAAEKSFLSARKGVFVDVFEISRRR